MIAKQAKTVLIIELNGKKHEGTIQSVLKLLDILTQEAREANDDANTPDTFFKNQGKVQAYRGLREYIERGLPGVNG